MTDPQTAKPGPWRPHNVDLAKTAPTKAKAPERSGAFSFYKRCARLSRALFLRQRALGLLDQLGKPCGVVNGDVGQDLSIQLNIRLLESVD